MDTRKKLREAQYFLSMLENCKETDEFHFVLSAFLSAWRSVMDVMLYDFADYFKIGLTRDDKMMPGDFWIVAHARKDQNALDFFKWWEKETQRLARESKLWNMRPEIIHRGYPAERIYAPSPISSLSVSITLRPAMTISPTDIILYPGNVFKIKLPDVVDICKQGFTLMESIVGEAERIFKIKLG
jgi:hypothetical protein